VDRRAPRRYFYLYFQFDFVVIDAVIPQETGSGLNLAPVSKTRRIQDDYVEISCEATRHLPYLSPGVAVDPISLEPLGEATVKAYTGFGIRLMPMQLFHYLKL
jgi:hypothetical protein